MTEPGKRITRADIEAKLHELGGDVEAEVVSARRIAVIAAIGVATVVITGAFLLGRRRGKRLATIVEIRRI